MKDQYIQIIISNLPAEQSDILVATLSAYGFEGFEEHENSLSGFITESNFSEEELNNIAALYKFSYGKQLIKSTNWNEEWEKNFDPVIVDDFVAIRADFHAPIKNVEHEIIITPKMSFGTGHHATTYLMMQQMHKIDFHNKSVFDFGTGTGILAILAEKLGSKNIIAVDNDEWSISNAKENIERNNCSKILLSLEDEPPLKEKFDIILANINKNVILSFIFRLAELLNEKGHLILSGLLQDDENDILAIIKDLPVNYIHTSHRNKWVCMWLSN
jgi:ribosomal protein L11 methyltransferase